MAEKIDVSVSAVAKAVGVVSIDGKEYALCHRHLNDARLIPNAECLLDRRPQIDEDCGACIGERLRLNHV